MSHKDLERLETLRKLNADSQWVNGDIYRLMYRKDFYVVAYERLKSKPGNMTPGADGSTIDGFSQKTIENIIAKMRDESFVFSRARRVQIPKAKGGTRPLGIASPRDKIVQEVIRMILEAIFDSPYGSSFHDESHGFRAQRSCHTALKDIRNKWNGVKWIIEGDVKAAFDNIDHSLLIGFLEKRISDRRFLNLIRKALTAGYYEFKIPINSDIGTPQGSIVSPILCNVFLHELDEFCVELTRNSEKGKSPRRNPEYRRNAKRIEKVRKDLEEVELRSTERLALVKELLALKKVGRGIDPNLDDGSFIRMKYVRYADDWCIGVNGPRETAVKVRDEIAAFMASKLKLELNMEKTHIRHAKKEEAFFLGTKVRIGSCNARVSRVIRNGKSFLKRNAGWSPKMHAPVEKLVDRLYAKGMCDKNGAPKANHAWALLDDDQIVNRFSSVWRGFMNYYSFVDNFVKLQRIHYILKYSAAKTLALKHRTTVPKIFTKLGNNLRVWKESSKGKIGVTNFPYVPKWDSEPTRFNTGKTTDPEEILRQHQRLRTRSKLEEDCCVCGNDEGIQMHHVRSIRTVGCKVKGFNRLLAIINRKQIPVCSECHNDIHGGRYDGLSLKDLANPLVASR